jgi:hypothetical protein
MQIIPVNAVDPQSHVAYPFTDVGQLDTAINNGFIPIHADGTAMKVQSFEGGHLLDGAPINVWMGLGWYAGQQAELQPYWQNGQIPVPPQNILNATVVAMPPAVQANWQNYMTNQQNIFGLPWWMWAAGVGAYLILT